LKNILNSSWGTACIHGIGTDMEPVTRFLMAVMYLGATSAG